MPFYLPAGQFRDTILKRGYFPAHKSAESLFNNAPPKDNQVYVTLQSAQLPPFPSSRWPAGIDVDGDERHLRRQEQPGGAVPHGVPDECRW